MTPTTANRHTVISDKSLEIDQKTYAGVLGKIIGVYLGRPVEGWPYEKIQDTFGMVSNYVNEECGMPLIVADDDISGSFGFAKAVLDHSEAEIDATAFAKTWLNYIIEGKTILWWGGLGRSTEHTAWLNLKSGIPAPKSGSAEENGLTVAEQVGSQIFIDPIAMIHPGDPDATAALAREAASVSHDRIGVEAAVHLAVLESLAYFEDDIDTLLDESQKYVTDKQLLEVIDDVRSACARLDSWREVRDYIEEHHGYSQYNGPAPMLTNHAAVLACIILGGNDFHRSVALASSMGWDTDSNAGNVGAFNGIRLGLDGINAGIDLRGPVGDRILVVTAEGGEVVTDAAREARKLIRSAEARSSNSQVDEEYGPRFQFEFPGSTQGWAACPYAEGRPAPITIPEEKNNGEPGLHLQLTQVGPGAPASISTPTFLDFSETAGNFSTIASPTLYEGQTVQASFTAEGTGELAAQPYILYYDRNNDEQQLEGPQVEVALGEPNEILWEIPRIGGMPIFRVGIKFVSPDVFTGEVTLESVDWAGAPTKFAQEGMMMTSIWETLPHWTQTWCSSAEHFQADFFHTLCISHPTEQGVATIGTRDWDNYRVVSKLEFTRHEEGGLVARAQGHRRYYALVLAGGTTLSLLAVRDDETTVLASTDFTYEPDRMYEVALEVVDNKIAGKVDGALLLEAQDDTYRAGEAGFYISAGSMTADGFAVEKIDPQS